MDALPTTITLASIGFAALGAGLMTGLKMWQGWLDLKRAELARRPGQPGEERGEIAELRARVRQLEAIAACVDI